VVGGSLAVLAAVHRSVLVATAWTITFMVFVTWSFLDWIAFAFLGELRY
jgi:hypothetical protein